MASENEVWKIENDLCRCCHNEGKFVNLVEPRIYLNQKEVYGEMLKDCFSIDIKPVPGVLCASTYTICDMCITQLRDAISFQKQILHCEKKFLDLYEKNAIKAKTEIIVKTEVDIEIEDDAKQNDSLMSFDEDDYSPEEDIEYELKIENEESDDDQPLVPKKRPKANPKPVPKPEPVSSKKPDSGGAKKKKEGKKTEIFEDCFTVRKDDNAEIFICNICSNEYKRRDSIKQHYRHVHLKQRPKLRGCYYCPAKVGAHMRAQHMEEAHGIPAPNCGACGKKFAFPFQVLRHQKIYHMGEKKFTCSVCNMNFGTNANLQQHIIKHTSDRPFKCDFCDEAFKWKKHLRRHLKGHINQKTR
ncbi:zinc finger and SCAN domain-containing protein 26-like isoform X9 [Leptidea sinapis]|uniref:zinc finger and SCAN domain-containing protein 26-like isoform X9 n=1 Tax=Leptidea sinapis TaxID=189913 RepID=UPI0021C3E9F7|nr:zinc finger and SCAN domain-containing protein 26-like isoform X9 [Leptidea sinapis]